MATIVFPGDRISIPSTSNVKLGPGLSVSKSQNNRGSDELVVTVSGYLGEMSSEKGKARFTSNQIDIKDKISNAVESKSKQQVASWVESNSTRYLPAIHDPVICQITNRGTESYQVTLFNSYTTATISGLAFEGATKRNKPNLKVGTLLYAQVMSSHRHLEVELTCVDPSTGKSNGYGELKTEVAANTGSDDAKGKVVEASAMMWRVSCGLSRSLLKPSHSLLSRLAAHFPFEVAVGVNGYIWVKASNPRHVIAVGKVLERADDQAITSKGESMNALQMIKARGVLSVEEISAIIEPFK